MPKGERVTWTTRQAADHCGITIRVLHDYRARNRFPDPIPDLFGPRGQRYFWADEVRRWQATRPGPGRRRDTPKET